ncbi:uncharacterized protein [Triticum aestivum]|uniref:uncharacterized protein n=1 Tax=Triticum aestivum TaxID=4565 RepID=UPI001D035158|nr:uncharacterized protein LOC123092483 [Triticum aestivum]XP_044388170.1 uncharacterized protein LOC123111434 [Triticum aestivum]
MDRLQGVSPTSNNKTPHFLNCAVIGSCPPRPLRWSRYSASFGFACCRGRRKAQANYISAPRLLTGDIDVCLTSGTTKIMNLDSGFRGISVCLDFGSMLIH